MSCCDFCEFGRRVKDVTLGAVVFCGGVQDLAEFWFTSAAGGRSNKGGKTRSSFATQSWRATVAVQPLHVMVRHCVGCVAGLHAIVARQSCFVSVRL